MMNLRASRLAWSIAAVAVVVLATAASFSALSLRVPLLQGVDSSSSFAPVEARSEKCTPTNQDQYVLEPERFRILAECIRVSGVVRKAHVNSEDMDALIDLELDDAFKKFLTDANYDDLADSEKLPRGVGYLHLEIVCYSRSEARAICANNLNALREPLPKVGQRIWVEGRWVLDLNHNEWAELHPVYRWGYEP